MKLLYVVQRYGTEIFGGAEQHCRLFAERLAARGHEVSVITSCAHSYVDWANSYPAGTEQINGVTVHRIPVALPRDSRIFDGVNGRAVARQQRTWVPPFLQREWMRLQGPWMPDLAETVARLSAQHDLTIFFTYLYYTTFAGLPAAQSPTVLHPTAHVERPILLPMFDLVFRLPDGFAFSAEEEAEFVRRRFRLRKPCRIIGIGTDLDVQADAQAFRDRYELGDRPYVVFLGRTDPGKGAVELAEFFAAYKRRHPGPLALAMVGEEVYPVPRHPDIVMTGFVDDGMRNAALHGALALMQPSYFESFSMVLAEAWAAGVPALVQSHSDVLVGHCRRSGAGLPYRGYAEFEAALEMLAGDEALRRRMGAAGRRYVEARYSWDTVLTRYEEFLERIATGVVPLPGQPAAAGLRASTA